MKERRQTRDGVRQGQSEKIRADAREMPRSEGLDTPRKYSHSARRLEEGQVGNLDVLLLRQQFCAALIEPALHIPERDLFA